MSKKTRQQEFAEAIDEREATQHIWNNINALYGKISHLVNFKYELLIYRLVKGKHIHVKTLAKMTGLSRQRMHQIIAEFEMREVERQHDNG